MHDAAVPALLSVAAVSVLSFAGASVLALGPDRLRRILPALVALAAGALLGDAFLHILPEASHAAGGFTPELAWLTLGGLLGFFLIEQSLHWHHHGHVHQFAWMNLLGDAIHNLIDGMLIAGTWIVSPEAGLATTIAVALHEIPQEFGDFGVLLHAGMRPRRALLLNFGTAVMAIAGAAIVLLLPASMAAERALAPIAAGGFVYVACADLVPELRDRWKGKDLLAGVVALGVGILLVAGLPAMLGLEHTHGHGHEAHDDDGHDHAADDHEGHDHD
jgi:zinc and cadmium transporter